MTLKNWYPFFVGDYSRDTARLSVVEHGAYLLLLNEYYSTGEPLENDIIQLYRVCRAFEQTERDAIDKILDLYFYLDEENNCFRNTKADKELGKKEEISQKRANAVRKRWGEKNKGLDTSVDTSVDTNGIPSTSTSTLSKDKSLDIIPDSLLMPDGRFFSFDQFCEHAWKEYPSVGRRKGSKEKFKEQIKKHMMKGTSHEDIISGVTAYARYCNQQGEFNRDAERWARDAEWNNDYQISAGADKPQQRNVSSGKGGGINEIIFDAEQAKKMLG